LTLVFLAGCERPAPDPLPPSSQGEVALQPVAAGLQQPVFATAAPGGGLLVVEQAGRIVRVAADGEVAGTFLDIRDRVQDGGERGLLGLAMEPDGGRLYVHYTDLDGDVVVARFRHDGAMGAAASEEVLLTVEQPYANHNGGHVAFGPDGMLYIALGDGGSGNDPQNHGQNPNSLLGAILRIDVSGDTGYGIPEGNPFAGGAGAPEVYVWGLRNPWRFSFDAATGDLWIGDVGQNAWEEIDYAPEGEGAGANYGWARLEGTHPFNGEAPPDAVPPIFEYPNPDQGCSVTGGFVYRGDRIPDLRGAYVFADYCEGTLRALRQEDGQVVAERSLDVSAVNVAAFGQDDDGELYVLSQGDGLLRIDPA
jgi:glucose/arabinose dehydrogenase